MPHAPSVLLPSGQSHIPQHYLRYQHTPQTLAAIARDIHCDPHTLLFAAADHNGMYLQVGMVGRENYERGATLRPKKLVYGRKWRIDADTPTAEIVQTAYLAIKKAHEHEVREWFTVTDAVTGKTSTPLSSHLDLKALVATSEHVGPIAPPANIHTHTGQLLARVLAPLRFGQRSIQVVDVLPRLNGTTLVDLQLGAAPLARQAEGDLHGFENLVFTVLWRGLDASDLVYAIMDALIQHSDRWVDEHFSYQGFARFSRAHDPLRLAQLSLATRPYTRDKDNPLFAPWFQRINFSVDASRAPALGSDDLALHNRRLIDAHLPLMGHMPQGYLPTASIPQYA